MATKIRLKRQGKKFYAFYRVVITDSRNKRDGQSIEEIGTYNPNTQPSTIHDRLRARTVLARCRCSAVRACAQAAEDHRRLAEVQGPRRAPKAR